LNVPNTPNCTLGAPGDDGGGDATTEEGGPGEAGTTDAADASDAPPPSDANPPSDASDEGDP
jgi:hypothetical protein